MSRPTDSSSPLDAADNGPVRGSSTVTGGIRSADGLWLARLAAAAVRAKLTGHPPDGGVPAAPALRRLGSSFVTLERSGALRGCIGTLEPTRPLYRDVARNAIRATSDPRMPPLSLAEWPGLQVTVSVLGPSEPMEVADLADLLTQVRPHLDGLTLLDGDRRSTFLPVVWHKLPEPKDFVAALLRKGGWPTDCLPPDVRVRRYGATEYGYRTPPD